MIVIIDYGMGNLGSMANMLKRVGAEATISADPTVIASADRLILPGVGAFGNGMEQLTDRGLVPVLNEQVLDRRKPILGVCLGMQLFAAGSDEGGPSGLSWISGRSVRFRQDELGSLKVPHMGWNTVDPERADPLFEGLGGDARFYFVHSYHLECDGADRLATTAYGYRFVSAVRAGNIAGVQFHPEKSHRFGMQVLRNFAAGV